MSYKNAHELPISRAIAARVNLALECLDGGDVIGARLLLRQCQTALPLPLESNVTAARDVLNRRSQ